MGAIITIVACTLLSLGMLLHMNYINRQEARKRAENHNQYKNTRHANNHSK